MNYKRFIKFFCLIKLFTLFEIQRLNAMEEQIAQIQEEDCAICLEKIKNSSELTCGHKFCRECIKPWASKKFLSKNTDCPLCRVHNQSILTPNDRLEKIIDQLIEISEDGSFEDISKSNRIKFFIYLNVLKAYKNIPDRIFGIKTSRIAKIAIVLIAVRTLYINECPKLIVPAIIFMLHIMNQSLGILYDKIYDYIETNFYDEKIDDEDESDLDISNEDIQDEDNSDDEHLI